MGKTTPKTRIKRTREKLENVFAELDEKRRKTAQSLIDNAAFMAVQLEDLSEKIMLEGPTCEYQNGENQWGTKKSPEVDVYNTMMKNFVTVIRTLCDMLPDGASAKDSPLLQFYAKGRAAK